MRVILAVCKDVGGANALLPVMDILESMYQIRWIAQENGRGKDVLGSLGHNFEFYSPSNQISKDNVVAVVSSMCSTAGQDLVKIFKGHCPIITIQDQWGAYLTDTWNEHRPDYILVNDDIDKEIVLKFWHQYGSNQVVITGYPALDKYAYFDVLLARVKVKDYLSLVLGKPVILFAGQWWNSGHALTELVSVINDLGEDVYLVARPHPGMRDNVPEEVPLWEKALADFNSGTVVDSSSYKNMSDLIAASDIVISMYSTTLMEAAILRLPNIAVLYPNHGMREYAEATKLDEFPMVSLGCTAKAENRQELRDSVRTGLTGDLNLHSAQEKTFQLDGKNSLRAAKFISSLI